jgi:hypothetical protein
MPGPFGPFPTTGAMLYLTWIALLAAALLGHTWLVRRLAVLAVALAAVVTMSESVGLARPPLALLLLIGSSAALVALAPLRRRTGIGASATALVLSGAATGVVLLSQPGMYDEWTYYPWYTTVAEATRFVAGGSRVGGVYLLGIAALGALLTLAVDAAGRRLDRPAVISDTVGPGHP